MTINHVAIWTDQLEELKEFYVKYFQGSSNEKYINSKKGFESYFITFKDGASLELMKRVGMTEQDKNPDKFFSGFTHLAFSVGSEVKVNEFTEQLVKDGFKKLDGPRTTGDGFYESSIVDPDGNILEITV
ncbi:MAG: VOC family protein [Flammeovirgaceae bacterium]|nr:VOC family protein [Flammeovirgaceae bacterium]